MNDLLFILNIYANHVISKAERRLLIVLLFGYNKF